jgi:hypothetical protein
MVPHAAPLQPAPLTLHVTAVFEVPVTVAANCWVVPSDTVALLGLTFITREPADFAGPVEFVKPAHPEKDKPPNRTTRERSPSL